MQNRLRRGSLRGIPTIGAGGAAWAGSAPTGLTATVVSDTEIQLDWTNVDTTGDGVSIERSTDGVNYSEIATVALGVAAYSNTSLIPNTVYYYRVKAYKGVVKGTASNVATKDITTLMTNLTAFWKLNESSGNAVDTSNTYTLTNNNTATYSAGILGNGVDLGSSNTNKFLNCNNAFGMTYQSSRSISFWVKLNSAPGAGASYYFSTLMFATNPGNYTSVFYNNNGGTMRIGDGTTYANITLTVGTWYHFAQTHDHAGNAIKTYVNGRLYITSVTFQGNYSAQTTGLQLGKILASTGYASAMFDEVGLFNKILTISEINKLYNYGVGVTHPFDVGRYSEIAQLTARCWFNSPTALYNASANKTWLGVVHTVDYSVTATAGNWSQAILTLDHATGLTTITRVGASVEADDHNEPSILVKSADNKLFTAYSEHSKVGSPIRYRTSTNALDATAWGAESTIDPNTGDEYTYINAFQVSNGDIYLFFRVTLAVDAHWYYVKSTDAGSTFGASTKFWEKPYLRIYQNQSDKDIIHFAGSYGANELAYASQLSHFYFDAGADKWYSSNGTDVTANIPLTHTEVTIILAKTNPERVWVEDLILDSNGYPRVLFPYYPDANSTPEIKYLYYSEWTGSAWTTPYSIHLACSKNISDAALNATYPPMSYFDRNNPNRIICGKQDGTIIEIFELTRVASNSFTSRQITSGSTYDQWRPTVTNAPDHNVFWFNKFLYQEYKDSGKFNESLICRTL